MSTLHIRLPSKAAADSAPQWLALSCPFALVSDDGNIQNEGVAPLSSLSDMIAKIQRVVLLLAAGDVTVLRIKVPPLSAARLKAALPNLVEEHLLCDPSECVVVAGRMEDGLRTIAVAQRAWLDSLTKAFIAFGARKIAALPEQSCLQGQPGIVTASIYERNPDIDLTLRLPEQDSIGLTINIGPDETAANRVIQTLCAVAHETPVTLYVPQAAMRAYQEAVADTPGLKERFSVSADNWTRWVAGTRGAELDLMAGTGTNAGPGLDWRTWRWPLALAAAVLLVNVSALNIEWWRFKSEAHALRSAMTQIYKSAYPNESVIIDPIAQMQQKIATAKRDSGLAAADDFTSITAAFGEAWAGVTATMAARPSIAALEYRDRSLSVRLSGGEAPTQQMKAALAGRDLSLELDSSQSATVWEIRSTK